MLNGVTILELGQVIAGTFGGVILADFGAEVIKIEPHSGDTARNPTIAPLHDESAIHLFMNRGKKSIVLDLKTDKGIEIFYRLVEQADVVVDNFRPGVMTRLGIDHESLKKRNPQIITVTVTGFGETGPARDKAAFDLVVQAYSGHVDITGPSDGDPARVGIPIADIAGGIYACISILAALAGRGLHGGGQHADVAMLDSLVSMLSYDALDYLNSGRKPTRLGTAHAHMVPWQAFETGDGYLVVAVRDEKFWQNLCDAIDRPDLKTDPRTANNALRVENREFLVSLLESVFALKSTEEWLGILDDFDIPNSAVNDIEAVFADPQVSARGMVGTYEHPTLGDVRYPATPVKLSDWVAPNESAPMLGQHTVAILGERLGFDAATVRELADEGVVKIWPESS
jgi:crotonobetainyl-CoA:carnitine CoA-transferase CaiB-like acyl-CoA transferase